MVSDYEKGKLRLHAEMVVRFARALGVKIDLVLGLTGNESERTAAKPDIKIMRRLNKIASLPAGDQKIILKAIDSWLQASQIEKNIMKAGRFKRISHAGASIRCPPDGSGSGPTSPGGRPDGLPGDRATSDNGRHYPKSRMKSARNFALRGGLQSPLGEAILGLAAFPQ